MFGSWMLMGTFDSGSLFGIYLVIWAYREGLYMRLQSVLDDNLKFATSGASAPDFFNQDARSN
jgi:hypothetical protein